jgi:hypothetical protein
VGHGDFEFLILNFGCWIDELVEVVESGESSYSICSVGRSGSVGSGGGLKSGWWGEIGVLGVY